RPSRAAPDHLLLRAALGLDRAPALAALRFDRPLLASEGLLRRLDHARGGLEGDGPPAAAGASLELLRPDGDRAARHGAEARGPDAQGGLLRARRAQRRDARRG